MRCTYWPQKDGNKMNLFFKNSCYDKNKKAPAAYALASKQNNKYKQTDMFSKKRMLSQNKKYLRRTHWPQTTKIDKTNNLFLFCFSLQLCHHLTTTGRIGGLSSNSKALSSVWKPKYVPLDADGGRVGRSESVVVATSGFLIACSL